VEFIELSGFDLMETGPKALDALWLRGGFPRSFLAASDEDSFVWREGFVRTYLERLGAGTRHGPVRQDRAKRPSPGSALASQKSAFEALRTS